MTGAEGLYEKDTIAAIATAPGEGGVAIVRLSGPEALSIREKLFVPAAARAMKPWRMALGRVIGEDGETIDEALCVFMRAPHSYTCEDLAELQCHGGRAAAAAVLANAVKRGARLAGPGEFTKRAFLNGRIDLSRAEAVMRLVSASGSAAARAAARQLEGGVAREVARLAEDITSLLASIEAADDFPEEIDEAVEAASALEKLRLLRDRIKSCADPRAARLLSEGASVALIGRANTGKSSLLNLLLGAERAIVTDIPGTTRDVLTESLEYEGLRFRLSDTAGQRECADPVEKIGVERAKRAGEAADLRLLVLDASAPPTAEDEALIARAGADTLLIMNKSDLPKDAETEKLSLRARLPRVFASAKTGLGAEELLAAIKNAVGAEAAAEALMTTERQLSLAAEADLALEKAEGTLTAGHPLDFAAVDLEQAVQKLLEITGESASEKAIDDIFASFCVGK